MTAAPTPPSTAELREMLTAPDLTTAERRELQRAVRQQRRVETWEARRDDPTQPRRTHRAVIELLLLAATFGVFLLLTLR